MKPIIAIVGRPNVGKSTFFNRITGTRGALVDDFPGVTRDRIHADVTWEDASFTLVDTGGFLKEDRDEFSALVQDQIYQAVQDADMIVLVLDGKAGVSPFDMDLVEMLRSVRKPIFYAVNKIDGPDHEENLYEFFDLGIEKPYPVSAEHGYGIGDFMDDLGAAISAFGPQTMIDAPRESIGVAVLGRPNVGKSSLINRILGRPRLIVSDLPGTTRDAVDTLCEFNGRSYLLIDTAGIRRKSRVTQRLEKFSVIKALRSLDRCDVALVVLDSGAGVTEQDIKIAGYAHDRGCGAVFLFNKWDMVQERKHTLKRYMEQLRMEAKFLSFAPALEVSAVTGQGVMKIFQLVDEVYRQYAFRLGTGELNRILAQAVERTEPSLFRGKRLKFYYATQVSAKPPTIVCFVNYPEGVHFSYKRYLINQVRAETGLNQTPVRMVFRRRERDARRTAHGAGHKAQGLRRKGARRTT